MFTGLVQIRRGGEIMKVEKNAQAVQNRMLQKPKQRGSEKAKAMMNALRAKQTGNSAEFLKHKERLRELKPDQKICRSCESVFTPVHMQETECSWCDALEGPN